MRQKLSGFLGLACLALLVIPQASNGQIFSKNRIDSKFVPEAACMSATVFPKKIADDPKFDLFPREIVTAWGKKEFGFDPMLMNQLTFVAVAPKGMMALQQGTPQWGMIMHFDEMQGLSGGLIDRLDKKRSGNRMLFSGTDIGEPSFLVYDEATMFAGEESLFEAMINAQGKSGLIDMMKKGGDDGQAFAYIDAEPLRPLLNELAQQIPGMMPPAISRIRNLPDMLKGIEVSLNIDGSGLQTSIQLHFKDTESAEQGQQIIADAMDVGKEFALGGAATQFDVNDPVQEATLAYIQRMAADYQTKFAPKQSGGAVSMRVANEAAAGPVLIGMLLPALQQVRSAARRTSSMNNMRQMTLAALNYESANGGFPAQANYDKAGKPLLSWRVHILPYIEQQALYDQFHLDEPWNSPHNRKLIPKMPLAYSSPSVAAREGMTVYLGIAGKNAVFGKEKTTFGQITDGSSNTALMIEVGPEMAVEWTRPTDYEYNERQPFRGLGGVNPGVFLVTFADGSTHAISMNVAPETWKSMTTINGGETLGDF